VSVKFLKNSKTGLPLGLVALSIMTGVGVSGLLSASKTVSSSGMIKAINVGVYHDLECTQEATSFEWGALDPGDVVSRTVYIKNTGNTDMTLYLQVINWTPAGAVDYLSITWDEESTLLSADQVVEAVITLTVDNSITGIDDFSFQLVMGGTG
jgi:hypothetical protein